MNRQPSLPLIIEQFLVDFVESCGFDIVGLKGMIGFISELSEDIAGDGHTHDGRHSAKDRNYPDTVIVKHFVCLGVILLMLLEGQQLFLSLLV